MRRRGPLGADLVVGRSPEESRRLLAEARSRPAARDPEERFRLEIREIMLDDGRWVFTFARPSFDPRVGALRTAIDGFKGSPDYRLFRLPGPDGEPPVQADCELKVRPNRPSPEQWGYLRLLRASGQRHAYLWTPDTMAEIEAWLRCPYGRELPSTPAAWLEEPPARVPFLPPGWREVWEGHRRRRLSRTSRNRG